MAAGKGPDRQSFLPMVDTDTLDQLHPRQPLLPLLRNLDSPEHGVLWGRGGASSGDHYGPKWAQVRLSLPAAAQCDLWTECGRRSSPRRLRSARSTHDRCRQPPHDPGFGAPADPDDGSAPPPIPSRRSRGRATPRRGGAARSMEADHAMRVGARGPPAYRSIDRGGQAVRKLSTGTLVATPSILRPWAARHCLSGRGGPA